MCLVVNNSTLQKDKLWRKIESHQEMSGKASRQLGFTEIPKTRHRKNPRSNQQYKTNVKTAIKFIFIIKASLENNF